jgi:hypothetical protein
MLLGAWGAGWWHLYTSEGWMNPIYLTPGRQVAAQVAHEAGAGDVVLAEDDTGVNYYLERMHFAGKVIDPLEETAALAALADTTRTRLWYVRLSRDGSARIRPAEAIEAQLRDWGVVAERQGYLESDPVYRAAKQRLLGLPGWRWRIVVERWERRAGH